MLTGENQTAQAEYADLVLLVDIFLCNSRASNTCLTVFHFFQKTVFLIMTSVFETKALKSLDFTGKIVYSMGCKATVRDVLLRLKNKWGSRGRWFESSHSDHKNHCFLRKMMVFCAFIPIYHTLSMPVITRMITTPNTTLHRTEAHRAFLRYLFYPRTIDENHFTSLFGLMD